MDKVQKIKEWISKKQDGLMNAQGNFAYREDEGAYHILCSLENFINTFEVKEVVSLDDACKWWEEELSYPTMTADEINWYKEKVNSFRKAMESKC